MHSNPIHFCLPLAETGWISLRREIYSALSHLGNNVSDQLKVNPTWRKCIRSFPRYDELSTHLTNAYKFGEQGETVWSPTSTGRIYEILINSTSFKAVETKDCWRVRNISYLFLSSFYRSKALLILRFEINVKYQHCSKNILIDKNKETNSYAL